MRIGRVIWVVAVLLVSGAVANVLVAWGCAWRVDYSKATEQIVLTEAFGQYGGYISVAQRTRPGYSQSIRRVMRPTSYGVGGLEYHLEFSEGNRHVIRLKPRETLESHYAEQLAQWHEAWPSGDGPWGLLAVWPWETSAGWPLRSMRCWHENLVGIPSSRMMATAGPVTIHHGIELGQAASPNNARVLPLYPAWGGFALNTLFYAVIFGLVYIAVGALRRHRRLRRGLCPICAYPIGVSAVCTECGHALKRPAEQPQREPAAMPDR